MAQFFGRRMALVVFSMFACCTAGVQAAGYTVTPFSRPGATTTEIWDINNLGQIVGNSIANANSDDEAFVYAGGIFTSLSGPADAIRTTAVGITDTGVVVGTYNTSKSVDADGNVVYGTERSYIYDGTNYFTFEVAGASVTHARAISPDGRYVTGFHITDTVDVQRFIVQGFIFDTVTHGFTFVGAGNDTTSTQARGINSSYVVVGSEVDFSSFPGKRPGFTYDINTGQRTDFMLPGTTRTVFTAIDDAGVISGWYQNGGAPRGFTGYPGNFQTIDVVGARATFVEGSNNAGILVGDYEVGPVGTGRYAFVATPAVPEPEVWAFMLTGLGLLALRRKH